MMLKFDQHVSEFLIIIMVFLCCTSCRFVGGDTWKEAEYLELGIPSIERYPVTAESRCVWDMMIWDDHLYIGGGDYDQNTGPVDIFRYHLESGTWEKSGTIDDEEANRFLIINDTLCIPGTDPREDWTYGNYYKWSGSEWEKFRTIPCGVHNYDLAEFNGFVYAALGVEPGASPIARSDDDGMSFVPLELWKNDSLINTSEFIGVRVYDLFVFQKNLYATLLYYPDYVHPSYELYRLEDDKFVFECNWYDKVGQIRINDVIVGGKAVFRDSLFFTTGYLYMTKDMEKIQCIRLRDVDAVYDIYVEGDTMYLLGGKKLEDGTYQISVWKNQSGKSNGFSKLFQFTYEAPAVSMVVRNDQYYIGIGEWRKQNSKNGMVLLVDHRS